MSRSRSAARYLTVFLASALGGVAFGRPFQTALQPPPVTPTGRVCAVKYFGAGTPAGAVEPIWFNTTGTIAVGADSNLYSTSPQGGNHLAGTAFRISPTGEVKVLHDFVQFDPKDGTGPASGLVDGHDGYFYGTTYGGGFGAGTIFRIRPSQTTAEILWRFRNGSTIGLWPDCADPYHRCPFTGRQRADISAAYPTTPPVVGPGGVLYGVTGYSNNQQFGVLYRDAPPYDSTSFHALCIFDQRLLADTAMKAFVCKAKSTFPNALLLGRDRATLYGTTLGGNGTVFRATTGGTGDVTTIHEFDLTHGSKPFNLMQASDGRLYGTTSNGGDTGGGIVYGLETSGDGLLGGGFKVMTSFRVGGWLQGFNPVGGLLEVNWPGREYSKPLLVGTTKFGGKAGRGIIFSIPLDGDSLGLRLLHEFDMYGTGRTPAIAPVLGPGGLLYGLTYQGGAYDKGVFYTLNPQVPAPLVHDAWLYNGVLAKDDAGVQLRDSIVQVMTEVTASQGTYDSNYIHGITVRARCPNPHIVQLIYRERLASWNVLLPGTLTPSSGTYRLTTDAAMPFWHTDVPLAKDSTILGHWNAYFDQALGAVHQSGAGFATIYDIPNFPNPPYPPSGQLADSTLSETWRANARDFVFCNCQLLREVWWSREEKAGKLRYAHIRIERPGRDDLGWLNANLQIDGYAPVP
jgi:uncharacterized repeat protein (TIGR03803 family)